MFDFLFAVTEWLRTTALLDFAFWITETPLSLFMVENFWLVPGAQVVHILAIAAAFGATLMLTLRTMGASGTGATIEETSARYVPWIWWGLLVIVISGLLMLTAEPLRNMINAVFWFKMIFLVGTILITLGFQKRIRAAAAGAGVTWVAGGGTKTAAIAILVLWCLIMVCGRWIAYVPV